MTASVVLDIGGDVGALVIYCPADFDGREIEVSPVPGWPAQVGRRPARVHAEVRRRLVGSGLHAAVFPGLLAGTYMIWGDGDAPAGIVLVVGGEVASYRWS